MTKTRREAYRDATVAEIKMLAWEQMAANGPATLSLRAIARAMQMSSAAIFRYYANRDALLTALSADAYHAQVAALESSGADLPPDAYAGRIAAAVTAYRDWALSNPVQFALIYGTPVPGYQPSWETLLPAAQRGLDFFAALAEAALRAGAIPALAASDLSPALRQQLESIVGARATPVSLTAMYWMLVGWTRIHGLVSLELIGQLGPLMGDCAELFQFEVRQFLSAMGFVE